MQLAKARWFRLVAWSTEMCPTEMCPTEMCPTEMLRSICGLARSALDSQGMCRDVLSIARVRQFVF
jgi:hypothetical protein